MKNILINNLQGYTHKELYSFIMACPEDSFEVQVARHNVFMPGMDNQQLSRDYAVAAWMGQKLYKQSTKFCYWVPCLTTTEPFSFELDLCDKESFVDTLFDIISNYINPGDSEKLEKFETHALIYFMQAWNQQQDAICWGLIEVCHDLFQIWKDAKKAEMNAG